MKEFIHVGDQYSLLYDSCHWLTKMGLRETRWILDARWILSSYDTTYGKWMIMGNKSE